MLQNRNRWKNLLIALIQSCVYRWYGICRRQYISRWDIGNIKTQTPCLHVCMLWYFWLRREYRKDIIFSGWCNEAYTLGYKGICDENMRHQENESYFSPHIYSTIGQDELISLLTDVTYLALSLTLVPRSSISFLIEQHRSSDLVFSNHVAAIKYQTKVTELWKDPMNNIYSTSNERKCYMVIIKMWRIGLRLIPIWNKIAIPKSEDLYWYLAAYMENTRNLNIVFWVIFM